MSPESKNVPDTFNFPGGIIMEWIKIFIPTTISSAALLSGIVFLLRKWIIDRLTQSIKHEYDKDLENHKEQLRKETESELTKLNGKVEVEVEKAKLKFNLYSQKQFELYNDLWIKLCELEKAKFYLKIQKNEETLLDFRDKLMKARDVLDQRGILIEPDHYEELHQIFNKLVDYETGQEILMQGHTKDIDDKHVTELIQKIMRNEAELEDKINRMKNYLRNQISGRIENSNEGQKGEV
jgi:hypothetical protein